MNRSRKSVQALTVVELLIIVAFLAILAAMFLPALARSQARSSRINCPNNLKQIGLAFKTWALDNKDRYPMRVPVAEGGTMELVEGGSVYPHFQVLSNELSTPKILVCPSDSNRASATNFVPDLPDTNLSYFVGVDVPGEAPGEILAGDRNLAIGSAPVAGLVRLPTDGTVKWTRQMHRGSGNILFGDGSVDEFSTPRLRAALRGSGSMTNRLAIPR